MSVRLRDKVLQVTRYKYFERDLIGWKSAEQLYDNKLQKAKYSIDEYFNEKLKELTTQQKIFRSALINKYKLRKVSERNQLCTELFLRVRQEMLRQLYLDRNQYQLLMIKLIVTGAIRMFYEYLLVRCLPYDQQMVYELLPYCKECFDHKMDFELGRTYPLRLSVDWYNPLKRLRLENYKDKVFLDKNYYLYYCVGGVIVCSKNRDVVYKNTLDCRMSILQEMSLPEIRQKIWRGR